MRIRIYDARTDIQPKSGYGLMSYQIKANLKQLGHEILEFPDDKSGEDVVLWIRPPHYLAYPEFDPNKKNVIFTMHESETFEGWKSNWPELLNKADAVITPTDWNKKVFEGNGVFKPIQVVPLGVNSKDYHGAKTYTFSVMTLHDALGRDGCRENWKDTIKAYFDAFSGDKRFEALLTIKSYNIDREGYGKYLDFLGRDDRPPIDIIDIDLINTELNNLYSKHWLFVKNANREGWSLPLLEAMSVDLPVAFTDIPVLDWAKEYRGGQSFPLGDVVALKNIMTEGHKNWKKKKGFINSLSWKQCTKQVENVLKSVVV